LRGKGRDQLNKQPTYVEIWRNPFPSPCGEKVGINEVDNDWGFRSFYQECFRPLAGKR